MQILKLCDARIGTNIPRFSGRGMLVFLNFVILWVLIPDNNYRLNGWD